MELSAFQIIGPRMVGPSSSHTAGAVRIGAVARALFGTEPFTAKIGLHGSFAATGTGHATDRALLAGLLGFAPDDERLRDAPDIARERGMVFSFCETDLGESVHANSVELKLESPDGAALVLAASSVGGGTINVFRIDGFETQFSCALPSLVFWHLDRPGFLARVTSLLACVEANIATLRTSRSGRSSEALTVIELDATPPSDALSILGRIEAVRILRLPPVFP